MKDNRQSVIPMLGVHDAKQAIAFYTEVFRAEEVARMTAADGRIEHSEIRVGETRIMIADEFPEHNRAARTLGGSPVILYLYVENVDETVERAIQAGARLWRKIENLPNGDRAGKVEDPFGHVWMLASPV